MAGRELTPDGQLCALGAGNCNDLELPRLLDAFDEIHLIDIDPAALKAAADRQAVAGHAGLRLHAPIDLTGIAEIVSGWKGRKPTVAEVHDAARASDAATGPEIGGPFDAVLSSCVLSQLVGYATDTLGGDAHAGFRPLVCAIRARHLRLILDLLKPGGTGLLICDLVSSDSLSNLPHAQEHELPGLIEKLARERNFFSGLYPDAMLAACRTDPAIASHIADARLLRPWLWKLRPRRSFLVYAIRVRRAASNFFVRGIDGSPIL